MSILITGGAGFIGSHTAKLLHESGYEVVILDNLSVGCLDNVRWGKFVHGDISDTTLVRSICREQGISAVIHLAASARVGDSMTQPDAYFANNITGSLRLLDAVAAEGVARIVFASSCSVYGDSPSWSAHEEETVTPMSPYGESKLQVERALRWYQLAFGMRWMALRYFNVAGASPGLGEDISTSIRIIPRAVASLLHSGPPLQVFGTTFATSDGTAVRDFVHVEDVARANLLALQFLDAQRAGEVINIGSGRGVSVLEIISAVSREIGQSLKYEQRPAKAGDPAHAVSDISKAQRLLAWKPAISGLENIVRSVVSAETIREFAYRDFAS
jgi:UDP-glucose-4-epimerase GalE